MSEYSHIEHSSLEEGSSGIAGVRKKLFDAVVDERIKVYLRVRPFSNEESTKQEDKEILKYDGNTIVTMIPPNDSAAGKSSSHVPNQNITNFEFSRVYPPETSQMEFFENTILQTVKNGIGGTSSLILSYGVTSSGKTYTMQGTVEEPGIVPRTLNAIFTTLHERLSSTPVIKPNNCSDLSKLSKEEQEQEILLKETLLRSSPTPDFTTLSLGSACSEGTINPSIVSQSQLSLTRCSQISELSDEDESRFCIWLSFAEIYNQSIFDLLNTGKQVKLRLAKDKNGNSYIKGLQEICVFSLEEALALISFAKKHLKFAETKMNRHSSRSHAIFSIKLVRFADSLTTDKAFVTNLTFCDLAGSERTKKTKNTDERLKETCSIHTSLLVLGRCIEALRHNQVNREKVVVPYRDSKLTNLFQPFFAGKGHISMIVNISSCTSTFDETLQVMKFSALARQVITNSSHQTKSVTYVGGRITSTWVNSNEPLSKFMAKHFHEASTILEDLDASLDESVDAALRLKYVEQVEQLVEITRGLEVDLNSAKKENEKLREEIKFMQANYNELFDKMEQDKDAMCERKNSVIEKLKEQKKKYFYDYLREKKRNEQLVAERGNCCDDDNMEDESSGEEEEDEDIEAASLESEEKQKLMEEIESLKGGVSSLEAIKQKLENEKNACTMQVTSLLERCRKSEAEQEQQKAKIALLTEKSKSQQDELKEMELKLAFLEGQNKALEKEKKDQANKIASLEEQNKVLEKEKSNQKMETIHQIEIANEQKNKLQKEIESTNAMLSKEKSCTDDLKAQVKDLKTQVEQFKCKVVNIEGLKKHNEELGNKIKQAELQLMSMQGELDVCTMDKLRYKVLAEELQKKFCDIEKRLCKANEQCGKCSGEVIGAMHSGNTEEELKDKRKTRGAMQLGKEVSELEFSNRKTRRQTRACVAVKVEETSTKSSISDDDFKPRAMRRQSRKRRAEEKENNSLLNNLEVEEERPSIRSPIQTLGRIIGQTSPAIRSAAQNVMSKIFPRNSPAATSRETESESPIKSSDAEPSNVSKKSKRRRFRHDASTTVAPSEDEDETSNSRRRLRPRK